MNGLTEKQVVENRKKYGTNNINGSKNVVPFVIKKRIEPTSSMVFLIINRFSRFVKGKGRINRSVSLIVFPKINFFFSKSISSISIPQQYLCLVFTESKKMP